jgi:HK97 family phage prohead protease
MTIERKSYPIANLKSDDETGIIEAIVSVFNNVDSGKEIVRPGFFEKSIQRKLPKGVWAHDWKQPIAKTLEAKELRAGDPSLPDHLRELGGTYIKGQFNLDTQRGKEAYSDIKFGIVDEFSIGYAVLKDGKDKDTGARELIEGDWKEWSPVLVGMNDQTALISIKAEGDTAKGMLAEEIAQTTPSTWEVEGAFRRVIRKIAEAAKSSDITDLQFDWKAKATVACSELGSEMTPLAISQIQEYLDSTDDEFYLKGITGTESFESFESAGSALEKFAQKMRSNHEIRTKEGRVLSSSNRAKVQACKDAMTALIADLDDLLAISEPKPKEKGIDVAALRTQSLRLESHALAVLSR